MKKVKDHKKTESILPFLHNQKDSEKITQHRTTNSDKNHKDTQKTKRIQGEYKCKIFTPMFT